MDHHSPATRARRPRLRHALTVAWASLVALLLAMPGRRLPTGQPHWLDKPAHLLLFAVLGVLVLRSLEVVMGVRRARIVGLASCAAYAVALETAQLWIPGRSWQWADLVAGLAGVAVASLALVRRRATLPGPP